jgi:hypothetical protein
MGLMPNVRSMLRSLQDGTFDQRAADNTSRRKVLKFRDALFGDINAFPIDSWMCRLLDTGKTYQWRNKNYNRSPKVHHAIALEEEMQEIATYFQYEPRQLMATLWSGLKKSHSKFKETNVRRLLEPKVIQLKI